MQYNIEETSISKIRTSISLNPDIEDLSISTNAPSISVYDIGALCFDIEFRVLRYRCFFVGSSLGCCSSYSVLDTDCGVCTLHCKSIITRGSCAARAALGRRSGACTRRRGRTGHTGRSTGRSRRSGVRTSRVRQLVRAERLSDSDQQSTSR